MKTFKKINGVLVQVERNENKRYHCIADKDDGYFLEFTEEEEKEHDDLRKSHEQEQEKLKLKQVN